MKWCFVNASAAGTAHSRSNMPCQDSSLVDVALTSAGEEILIAVVSDGAGSAAKAEAASDFVCRELFKKAEECCKAQPCLAEIGEGHIKGWILGIREDLLTRGHVEGVKLTDYACTVLLAIVGASEAIYAQIGDGAIVVGDGAMYSVVFWPETGEYANTTYFITDEDLEHHLKITKTNVPPCELAILTDGLQRIALKYDTKTPYHPFFLPMFQRLQTEVAGMPYELCDELERFLSSAAINERTDDDKTLLLAARYARNCI